MNTSMTINATAAWLMALYIATADEQGAPRSQRRVDEPVRVVLDLKRLHFFDPVSKLAIH